MWCKVDYCSHIYSPFPRGILKSTSVFKSQLKVRFVRHKVVFGFQVAYHSPLRVAQSRLRFPNCILMSVPPTAKVDFGFQVAF
jgi:hypothetical protein